MNHGYRCTDIPTCLHSYILSKYRIRLVVGSYIVAYLGGHAFLVNGQSFNQVANVS